MMRVNRMLARFGLRLVNRKADEAAALQLGALQAETAQVRAQAANLATLLDLAIAQREQAVAEIAQVRAQAANLATLLDLAIAQREQALAERDAARTERDVVGVTTPAPAAADPVDAVLRQQGGTPSAPLAPKALGALCRAYDGFDGPQRERLARAMMLRINADPSFARLLGDELVEALVGKHALRLLLLAMERHARGDVLGGRNLLHALVRLEPSPFHHVCLARSFVAMDDETGARAVLTAGLERFPGDLSLTMELSTSWFRDWHIERANALLAGVQDAFREEQRALEPLAAEIAAAVAEGHLEKTQEQDIYTADFVEATWWFYWTCYRSFNEHQEGSVWLDYGIRRHLAAIIEAERITTVVDFGAFCGYTIWRMAQDFPEIAFVGIDRPERARALNDMAFRAPNLRFLAGDVLHRLEEIELTGNPMLFHSRTACFCYPEYLRRLYALAARCGIRHVAMQEGAQFSRTYLEYFPFGEFPQVSIAMRGATFLHDYPTLLGGAGFVTVDRLPIRPRPLLDDRSGFGANHFVLHARRDE